MKSSRSKIQGGFSLVELLVYMSVMVVLLGVGYVALYRSMDTTIALRRNGDDIANALRAGENWRADIRAAGGKIQSTNALDEQTITLPGRRGEVSYRFAEHKIFRRVGNSSWSPVLDNVNATTFISESRHDVTVCRWELELQTRTKKLSSIRPLFTFLAVPAGDVSK